MIFDIVFGLVALVGGAVAAIAGFGIGSLLTPTLATQLGTKLAVAAVSIPHAAGTFARFALIWRKTDKYVLVHFGIASAAGGLAGALLHTFFSSIILSYVLGVLLIFAGITNTLGLASKMRFGKKIAWVAGMGSGLFGGLVGNQGGIRSAALFGFELDKEAFVATSTAIGLMVDAARLPVYLATQWSTIIGVWPYLLIGTVGVLLGTLIGKKILNKIPETMFRRVVGVIILLLGVAMIIYPSK